MSIRNFMEYNIKGFIIDGKSWLEHYYDTNFIKGLMVNQKPNNKIMSMDIEAYPDCNGIFQPYATGYAKSLKDFKLYYVTDFKDSNEMILHCFNELMIPKNNRFTIYIHNLAGFDSILLFKLLASHYTIKPLIRNNKVISLTLSKMVDGKIIKLIIHDSYLILSSSLRVLSQSFGIKNSKGIFPHEFMNKSRLNYIGLTPGYEFYDSKLLKLTDYYSMVEKRWNCKLELLKYLKFDLLSLYEVVSCFNKIVFDNYSLNLNTERSLI